MPPLQAVTTNLVRGAPKSEKFSGSGLTARLALDDATKADAYALRHRSYVTGGYIDPQPGGLFSDADDLRPTNRSIVIYKHRRPVASVRLCTLDWRPGPHEGEIPASRIFPEAVAKLAAPRCEGRPVRLTEINRLVRHPDFATASELVFVLFRFVSFLVIETDADMMLNCVRRNHTPFYKRMHFSYVDGPRRYAGVKFETDLMSCPRERYARLMSDIPFVATDDNSKRAYAGLMQGETVTVFAEA
jgi:hypothetical protein